MCWIYSFILNSVCVCSSLPPQRPAGPGLLHAALAHRPAAVEWPRSARQGGGREREVRDPRIRMRRSNNTISDQLVLPEGTWRTSRPCWITASVPNPFPVSLHRCCSAPNKCVAVLHQPLFTPCVSCGVAAFKAYLSAVMSLQYSEQPDYSALKDSLSAALQQLKATPQQPLTF